MSIREQSAAQTKALACWVLLVGLLIEAANERRFEPLVAAWIASHEQEWSESREQQIRPSFMAARRARTRCAIAEVRDREFGRHDALKECRSSGD